MEKISLHFRVGFLSTNRSWWEFTCKIFEYFFLYTIFLNSISFKYTDAKPIEPRKVSFQTEIVKNITRAHRRESSGSQSTPRSISSDVRSEDSTMRSSPLLARSSLFYQPAEKEGADDLPEADQRTPRKEGSLGNQEVRARPLSRRSSNGESYSQQRPQDVASTPNEPDNQNNPSSGANSNSRKPDSKPGSHEKAGKKKSALWYDYGNV